MEIELNNLVKTYQKASAPGSVYAVRGISLRIPSNTIFGIIGKSGAGNRRGDRRNARPHH